MQYLLLIYENEKRFSQGYPEAESGEYMAFGKEFAGAIKGSNALQPTKTATTVRVRDGKPLTTDGPFAETKEQLGGYYLVEARDSKEVAAMARWRVLILRAGYVSVPVVAECPSSVRARSSRHRMRHTAILHS